jgi:hypothetical protein
LAEITNKNQISGLVFYAVLCNSQREIEQAVRKAIENGLITGAESFPATVTLEVPRVKLNVKFDDEIKLQ